MEKDAATELRLWHRVHDVLEHNQVARHFIASHVALFAYYVPLVPIRIVDGGSDQDECKN